MSCRQAAFGHWQARPAGLKEAVPTTPPLELRSILVPAEVPPQPVSRRISARPVLWLNRVCLDAPLVALSWQWLFARVFEVEITGAARAALGLTVWLIYLADRLADVTRALHLGALSDRHRFCSRRRHGWALALGLVACVWLVVVGCGLDRSLQIRGAILGAFSLLYLSVNLSLGRAWKFVPLKEAAIGTLFAAGTLLALVPALPAHATGFVFAFLLFAVLCFGNCVCIAAWERPLDQAQGKNSLATRFPQVDWLAAPALLVFAGSAFGLGLAYPTIEPVGFCGALSALSLSLLHHFRANIALETRTALADLALLTPWILAANTPGA